MFGSENKKKIIKAISASVTSIAMSMAMIRDMTNDTQTAKKRANERANEWLKKVGIDVARAMSAVNVQQIEQNAEHRLEEMINLRDKEMKDYADLTKQRGEYLRNSARANSFLDMATRNTEKARTYREFVIELNGALLKQQLPGSMEINIRVENEQSVFFAQIALDIYAGIIPAHCGFLPIILLQFITFCVLHQRCDEIRKKYATSYKGIFLFFYEFLKSNPSLGGNISFVEQIDPSSFLTHSLNSFEKLLFAEDYKIVQARDEEKCFYHSLENIRNNVFKSGSSYLHPEISWELTQLTTLLTVALNFMLTIPCRPGDTANYVQALAERALCAIRPQDAGYSSEIDSKESQVYKSEYAAAASASDARAMAYDALPLSSFLQEVYQGYWGVYADNLLKKIQQRPELAIAPSTAEHFQLQFLYICVSDIYLQNACQRTDCARFGLRVPHSIIDHLKQLFFAWAKMKYPTFNWAAISALNEYLHMANFLFFLLEQHNQESLEYNVPLASMVATLAPFLASFDSKPGYDVQGKDADIYKDLHKFFPHPYVRLGGVLQYTAFELDCYKFDMRGIDMQGARFYGSSYRCAVRDRKFKPEDLLFYHANFSGADLRYANLSQTDFHLIEALFKADLQHTLQDRSNISLLREGKILATDIA